MSPENNLQVQSVEAALAAVRQRLGDFRAQAVVCLGSGMSDVASRASVCQEIEYSDIPGMAVPSVPGHPGRLTAGGWSGTSVLIFQGRLHRYEGHDWNVVTMPIRIAAGMGVGVCVMTNMSGAIRPELAPGSLVVVDDHVDLMGANSLAGVPPGDSGPHPSEKPDVYSYRLRQLLDRAGRQCDIPLEHGVYAGVSGPNYETPAEVRALRVLGADIVGMSTIGEVTVARQLGLECCAISCAANMAAGVTSEPIRHQDVLCAARSAHDRLARLLEAFLGLF